MLHNIDHGSKATIRLIKITHFEILKHDDGIEMKDSSMLLPHRSSIMAEYLRNDNMLMVIVIADRLCQDYSCFSSHEQPSLDMIIPEESIKKKLR